MAPDNRIGGSRQCNFHHLCGFPCQPPDEVLRESRTAVTAPGAAWTQHERTVWAAQAAAFLRKRAASDSMAGEGRRKRRRLEQKKPRLASFDYLCAMQNTLESSTGVGLERFLPTEASVGAEVPFLMLCMDYDQKIWCPFWYLRHHLALNVEATPDFTHRRMRDLDLATDEAGLRLEVTRGHVCNNAAYGPWQGGGYMRDIEECAMEVSANLTESDSLLMHFWPAIVADLELPPEDRGEEGRRFSHCVGPGGASDVQGPA